MKLKIVLLVFVLTIMTGCQRQPDNTPASPVSPMSSKAAPKADATVEDWKAALASAYVESNKKDEGDGVTTFTACFDDVPKSGNCSALMFAKRDAFRKVTHFTPVASTFQRYEFENYVFSYLALSDCKVPTSFFVPHYSAKSGWLFIKKVAVLAGGEVALERDFSGPGIDVKREVFPNNSVKEEVHLIATEADRTGVKKITQAKEISVRITGEKGYVNLKARQLASLREDLTNMHFVYDKLNRVLTDKMPPTCK